MKILPYLFALGVCLVQGAPSGLLSPQQNGNAVQLPRHARSFNYPGYYLYNYLQIDHARELPIAIFADGRPAVTSLQPTYAYYGTPVYDYRHQFNQIFPGLSAYPPATFIPNGQFIPSQIPTFPSTTTQRPPYEEDGIEKLDEKLEPSSESKDEPEGNAEGDDDDTVTIDAI